MYLVTSLHKCPTPMLTSQAIATIDGKWRMAQSATRRHIPFWSFSASAAFHAQKIIHRTTLDGLETIIGLQQPKMVLARASAIKN